MTEKRSSRVMPAKHWGQDRPKHTLKGLREIRRRYLKENRRKLYKEMRDNGTLEKHLDQRAESCVEEQKYLLAMRIAPHDEQAWSWAIRSALLDSEWD